MPESEQPTESLRAMAARVRDITDYHVAALSARKAKTSSPTFKPSPKSARTDPVT
jgi:hypothetical protein